MGTKGIFGLIRQQFDYGSSFYLEASSNTQLRPKGYILVIFFSEVMCLPPLEFHGKHRGTKPFKFHLLSLNIVVCNAEGI